MRTGLELTIGWHWTGAPPCEFGEMDMEDVATIPNCKTNAVNAGLSEISVHNAKWNRHIYGAGPGPPVRIALEKSSRVFQRGRSHVTGS